ncbi:MAG: AtpZ/AtpI family protein [Chloroflexi bacterium]|nr:AtpZ/AtpI family protein [Chloroflexota bacterium]
MNEQASHSPRLPKWVMRIALSVAVGLALGFAIGWWLWPVEYTNTAPNVLRRDYRDDYILMVATAYEIEGRDVEKAQKRLELLDPVDPTIPVIELAERLVAVGGSVEDITRLDRLAQALGSLPSTLTPYMEDQS